MANEMGDVVCILSQEDMDNGKNDDKLFFGDEDCGELQPQLNWEGDDDEGVAQLDLV